LTLAAEAQQHARPRPRGPWCRYLRQWAGRHSVRCRSRRAI